MMTEHSNKYSIERQEAEEGAKNEVQNETEEMVYDRFKNDNILTKCMNFIERMHGIDKSVIKTRKSIDYEQKEMNSLKQIYAL